MTTLIFCRKCEKPQATKLFDGTHLKCEEEFPQGVCRCCLQNSARACHNKKTKGTKGIQYEYEENVSISKILKTEDVGEYENEQISPIFKTEVDGKCKNEENEHIALVPKSEEDGELTVKKEQMITTDSTFKINEDQTVASSLEGKVDATIDKNEVEENEQILLIFKVEDYKENEQVSNTLKATKDDESIVKKSQMIITDSEIETDNSQTEEDEVYCEDIAFQECATKNLFNEVTQEEKKNSKPHKKRKLFKQHKGRGAESTQDEAANKNEIIKCDICGKVFQKRCNLRWHYRCHVEKRYQCELCEYKGLTSRCLEIHSRTHTGERPYACSSCEMRFATIMTLKDHIKSHTGERSHSCKYCGQRFSRPIILKKHIKIHENVRPHVCVYCDKAFAESFNLRAHLVTHTGISRYNCDTCKQAFQYRNSLMRHYKTQRHLLKLNNVK